MIDRLEALIREGIADPDALAEAERLIAELRAELARLQERASWLTRRRL